VARMLANYIDIQHFKCAIICDLQLKKNNNNLNKLNKFKIIKGLFS
jgi:hypothetical protein